MSISMYSGSRAYYEAVGASAYYAALPLGYTPGYEHPDADFDSIELNADEKAFIGFSESELTRPLSAGPLY